MLEQAAPRRCRPWLGTLVEVEVPAGHEEALEAAFAMVATIHRLMSFHEDGSDLAALRNAPAGTVVEIDALTVAVLRTAAMLAARSQGLFDITVGARLAAWGFLPNPLATDPEVLDGAAADIEILDETHVVCHRPMLIDLGGIAKGFAVDCAVDTLRARGAGRGVVNAGGDLRVFGDRSERIYLRGADGGIEGSIDVRDAAVASSSNAHQRGMHDGRETSPHIGRHNAAVIAASAVTVVAPRCILADAMTKIALADPILAETILAELGGALLPRQARRLAA